MSGINPKIALEFGRRAVPKNDRPSFMDLEEAFKEQKKLKNSRFKVWILVFVLNYQ